MINLIDKYENQNISKLISKKRIPTFRSGDTLKVNVKITEGKRTRLQAFEGVCIARKNNGINSSFTIRKISHGEGVERVFPLFSPVVDGIEVIKKAKVKRAKLYYLRNRKGKSARIADNDRGDEQDQYAIDKNLIKEEDAKIEKTDEDKTSKDNKENDLPKEINLKNKSSTITANETVIEEKGSAKEKSESTASEAEKTKDESKS